MPLNYILLYTTTYTNNSLMINFNINPPLSQGISRTQPWCHASQHETWPVSCLQGLQDLQGITCPGSTLVPPHLFPAFGSRHGPPGKSIVDRWPGHLTDLWIFIVYIYIYMMYEIALSYLNSDVFICLYHLWNLWRNRWPKSFRHRPQPAQLLGPINRTIQLGRKQHRATLSHLIPKCEEHKGTKRTLACELSRSQNVLGIRMER